MSRTALGAGLRTFRRLSPLGVLAATLAWGVACSGPGRGPGGEAAAPARAFEAADMAEERVAASPSSPAPARTTDAAQAPPTPTARMIHYSGDARLRATSPRETIDRAVAIAEAAGGYVEDLRDARVVLRVPSDRFEETFGLLLGLGDVLHREVRAEDVTEAHVAAELRLRTARATRQRLRELLERAREEKEKVELLRQIQRLSLEIEQIEAQLRHLESLAAFSRITLEIEARKIMASSPGEDLGAFAWIRSLGPFGREPLGDLLELPVPEGMVRLGQRSRFVAESADGAALWTSARRNDPAGSTDFWIAALEARLAPEFASAEILDVGEWRVLRLVGRDETAYRYLVGVRVDGDELAVVEAYYPRPAHEERYGSAVLASLSGETS